MFVLGYKVSFPSEEEQSDRQKHLKNLIIERFDGLDEFYQWSKSIPREVSRTIKPK